MCLHWVLLTIGLIFVDNKNDVRAVRRKRKVSLLYVVQGDWGNLHAVKLSLVLIETPDLISNKDKELRFK